VCPLALAGTWGWKSAPERDFFERVGRERGVRYLGYVADEDLPPLYTGATALLYPSFYEGFGLPPVEAMACGTAAIVSTADAVSEVVGNHALQIHPDDLAGWRNAMHRAITDRDSLERYRREGMGHAAQYGWDRAARVTLEVYHRVLGLPEPLISTAVSSRAAA
jgi:alpha-1,3-rhamnosyl/mannosyltransferase